MTTGDRRSRLAPLRKEARVAQDAVEPIASPAAEPSKIDFEQEIRFAVVMYGGVSLAIYINGVAQELLSLVRATAPTDAREPGSAPLLADEEIAGTTAEVYREIGRILHRKPTTNGSGRIRTRFVVDVLSGSSAGGLNAIYLAKALANDQPIEALKDLWVDEADIAKIVNDKRSYEKRFGLRRRRPPASALNSQRMYWLLLNALDGMDRASPRDDAFESPYVDELDLWITTTDVRGITVPLDLYDRLVFEKRHKKIFRFLYRAGYAKGELDRAAAGVAPPAPPDNDFVRSSNPFLAFAGRCTSAFPFAFEPMQLTDIDAVLDGDRFRDEYGGRKSDSPAWRRFFEDYLKPGDAKAVDEAGERDDHYRTQSFADGGYLDNKPFSWATRSLGLRRAVLPVDRFLLYIEPDPGSAGLVVHEPGETGDLLRAWKARGPLAHLDPEKAVARPNAIENALAAATGIPRSEPIREDIDVIVGRNRDLDRIEYVTAIVDEPESEKLLPKDEIDLDTWRGQSVADNIARRGIQYGGYHRLKVASVADDLAEVIARLSGFDENSDESSAIRCYLEAWAQEHHPEDGTGEQSQNEFLLRYDLGYRLRRAEFLIRQIDRLSVELPEIEFGDARKELSAVVLRLRSFGRYLRRRTGDNPIREQVEILGFDRTAVRHVLDKSRSKRESVQRARGRLREGDLDAKLTNVANAIAWVLLDAFDDARADTKAAIATVGDDTARTRLEQLFRNYEIYDSVLFPTSYGYVSEHDHVDVVRISPQDATSIIDETLKGETRRKLAGSAIHHFGGFFDAGWRRNDILWGRLDAAERLITSLLPQGGQRADLLERAQLAIIREEFTLKGGEALQAEVVERVLRVRAKDGVPVDEERLREAVRAAQEPKAILEFLKKDYRVESSLEPGQALETLGRVTAVSGEVLDGIAESPSVKRGLRLLIRVGRLLWGLGEIATRRSLPALLWQWWAQLLIVIGVLMILGGAVFGSPSTAKGGWLVLGFVAVVKVATWLAQEIVMFRDRRTRLLWILVAVAILVGTASTAWAGYTLARRVDDSANAVACRHLPGWAEKRAQALWPWDEDACPGSERRRDEDDD